MPRRKAHGMHPHQERVHHHDDGRTDQVREHRQGRLHGRKIQGRVRQAHHRSPDAIQSADPQHQQLPALASLVHSAVREPSAQGRLHCDSDLLGLEPSLVPTLARIINGPVVDRKQRFWRERQSMCPHRAFQLARVETGSVCELFLLAATVHRLSPRRRCSYASPEHTKLGLQQLRVRASGQPSRQRALSDHGHHVHDEFSQRARVLPPSRLHRQTVGRLAGQELQPPQRTLPDGVAEHARNVSQAAGFAKPQGPSGWSARGIQSRRQVEIGILSCWLAV